MRNLDFSSWHALATTLLGLMLFTVVGVGLRLVTMVTIQQRRERMNRQINERLRTLIAAYRTLGGSFTGNLEVDPRHLRQLLAGGSMVPAEPSEALDLSAGRVASSDRARRIRDAVEAALADIILLGTEDHVRLAHRAACELVAGHPVHTQDLVVSLRAFIREALDLDPIPAGLSIPMQGPARPSASGGKDKSERGDARGGSGGGSGGGGMGMGGGMSMGGGTFHHDQPASEELEPHPARE